MASKPRRRRVAPDRVDVADPLILSAVVAKKTILEDGAAGIIIRTYRSGPLEDKPLAAWLDEVDRLSADVRRAATERYLWTLEQAAARLVVALAMLLERESRERAALIAAANVTEGKPS